MPSNRLHHRGQNRARNLIPLIVWICGITVGLCIRYVYYGNQKMVLGPNSSRMLATSSVFVEEVQVRDDNKKGLVLYGFVKPPKLSVERNWTVSSQIHIDSYGRQGISLWLNEGSKIRMEWDVVCSSGYNEEMIVVIQKGNLNVEEMNTFQGMLNINVRNVSNGIKETTIDEDYNYYIGIVNLSPWDMAGRLKLNVASKMYDTGDAASICSPVNGLCNLKLHIPKTQYFVVTTPNNNGTTMEWHIQFSFPARLISYFLIIGFLVLIVYLILHYLEAYGSRRTTENVTSETETDPIVPIKEIPCTYQTNKEDPATSSMSCSSKDLYDKICAICFDEVRNCFFTPCGHNIACYSCAKRIMKQDNRVCPICRRVIHKVRRLVP